MTSVGAGARPLRISALAILACVVLIASAGAVSGSAARPVKSSTRPSGADAISRSEVRSSALVHTDRTLLHRRSPRLVEVMVKLDYDPVASYSGGLPGLSPTSPQVTGRSLDRPSAAVADYERYVAGFERGAVARIQATIPSASVLYSYRLAYGGLGLRLPLDRIGALVRVPGVAAVQRAPVEHPLTDVTPKFLKATAVWPSLGGSITAGKDVTVGVIDTGIWPEHPSFQDRGLPPMPGSRACQFGDGTDPDLGAPFTCNDKLIGAYAFTQAYLNSFDAEPGEFCDNVSGVCSARDSEGHGTHTTSTAAGDAYRPASIFGVPRGLVSGMAPGARIIAYRICLEQGCFGPDAVAAVNQAIADGVDVINYSISGGQDYQDSVELAFLDAYAAGISVNAAAGNAGPAAGTINHVGPWTDTVGAATSPRQFATTVHLHASNGDTLDVAGASVTAGLASPAPVVEAGAISGYGDPLCLSSLPPGSATGDVVVCRRGQNARVDKGLNAKRGGAAAMILYNPAVADVETDNHWLPAVHMDFPAAQQLLGFTSSHAGVTATFPAGQPTPWRPDVMAAFSSRGPAGDFIKPDVIAPGIQILAGKSPQPIATTEGPPGELYQAIAGTSMASPHAAGLAALLRAGHPGWTPGQIKSALMTSAVQDAVKEDGSTPADPFDRGAGRVQAKRAMNPTLTFDVPATDYRDRISDPSQRLGLNLPSVDVPVMPGSITTQRTALNVSGASQAFHVVTTAPQDASITVAPSDFTVAPGATQTLSISIDGSALEDGQYFGSILLDAASSGVTDVRLPVAFDRQPGAVSLTHSCEHTTLAVGGTTACSVTVANRPGTTTTYSLTMQAQADRADLSVDDVGRPGRMSGNGFTAQDTLSPSTAPPVKGLVPGGPAFLDLRTLGIAPLPTFRDEAFVNKGAPRYLFGHQRNTAIGISANGYLLVGGGSSTPEAFRPQTFPDIRAPNNVLAPLWTDLDPSSGGKIYYTKRVIRGGHRWIVVEWRRVPIYHTTRRETFEVWIRTGASERIAFAYSHAAAGAATGLNVGAENSDGTSGVNLGRLPASGEGIAVVMGLPRPGETETIPYHITGHTTGTYTLVASMTSPSVDGVTVRKVRITVGS